MRSKSFWEKKLAEAKECLDITVATRSVVQRHLEYQQLRWKNRHRLKPMKREVLRCDVDRSTSKLAKLDREIFKLTTTKIPYYEQMLAQESRTVWHRIRTGDGLRV
jgi:hypothetical protein